MCFSPDRKTRGELRYSAAVGGAGPMLEAVDRAHQRGDIKSLAAVLNGLQFPARCLRLWDSLASAIREAQRLGFAEADPTEDLSGRDAARKDWILARHAFGVEASVNEIQRWMNHRGGSRAAVAQVIGFARLLGPRQATGKGTLSVSFEPVTQLPAICASANGTR